MTDQTSRGILLLLDESAFRTLLYWIRERELLRLRKEAGGPPPWTDDEILREWRFCNVNRCDDKVTRWIHANVTALHDSSPSLWFNLVIARLVNWPPTLEKFGYVDSWDPCHFTRTLADINGKVFTGAYMIPAGAAGVAKPEYLALDVLTPLWNAREDVPDGQSCARWAHFLGKTRSMGDFLVNQVVTDMKYASSLLARATDRDTFVLAGPGTQRGLARLQKAALTRRLSQIEAGKLLLELRERVVDAMSWTQATFVDLNNLANCLCEFDKYVRVLLGEGKPRTRYVQSV